MNDLIEHDGIITGIENGRALVLIEQTSACAGCHAKSACTSADKADKIIEAIIPKNQQVSIGERVTIVGQRNLGLQAVFIAFVAPFSIILITLLILNQFVRNEAISGTIALSTLIPYFGIIALSKTKLARKFEFYVSKQN